MKKKIIIFTSTGGGGHISVSTALNDYLKREHNIEEVFIFKLILNSLDPIMSSIFGRIDGENIYNYFMKKKWYKLANLLYSVGEFYFTLRSRSIQKILENYFNHKKPDLVISVIPIINQDVFCATKKLNIPFLLIPTDLDSKTFLYRLKNTDKHPQFKVSLSFEDDDIKAFAKPINPSQVVYSGFPLRSDFFKDKNKTHIHQQFDIPEDKPRILLLMGTQGSNDMLRFVKELSKLDIPAHLICCIGKNESIRSLLQTILLPAHISLSIIGFTKQISDLMAISDLIISKSGSVSFCETIYSNVPTMLDATSTILRWEHFNHYFFEKNQLGAILSADSPIAEQVREVLTNKKLLTKFKNNLLTYEKKQPHKDIPKLIDEMLTYQFQAKKETSNQEAFVQLSIATPSRHK